MTVYAFGKRTANARRRGQFRLRPFSSSGPASRRCSACRASFIRSSRACAPPVYRSAEASRGAGGLAHAPVRPDRGCTPQDRRGAAIVDHLRRQHARGRCPEQRAERDRPRQVEGIRRAEGAVEIGAAPAKPVPPSACLRQWHAARASATPTRAPTASRQAGSQRPLMPPDSASSSAPTVSTARTRAAPAHMPLRSSRGGGRRSSSLSPYSATSRCKRQCQIRGAPRAIGDGRCRFARSADPPRRCRRQQQRSRAG